MLGLGLQVLRLRLALGLVLGGHYDGGSHEFLLLRSVYISNSGKRITIIISPACRDHKPRAVKMRTQRSVGSTTRQKKMNHPRGERWKRIRKETRGKKKIPTRRRTGLGESLNNGQSDRVTRALSTSAWPTIRYGGRSCPNAAPSIIG